MKFGIKHLRRRTPRIARRIGNALASAGMTVAGIGYINEYTRLAIAAAIAGGVGKFITELFTDEKTDSDTGA